MGRGGFVTQMGRCLHEGVREGLPLDRKADRERKREEQGELQDCTMLISFQYSILKLWNKLFVCCSKVISCLYKQSGFTDITTCIYKYYSPKDVEFY